MTKIAIIDMDSVAFSIGLGNKVLDSNGFPIKKDGKFVYVDKTEEELKESADYWMNEILTKGEFTHYIGYIKGYGTVSDRVRINPDYKANRPKESPKWWKQVKEYLIDKWGIIEANGAEVDDFVLTTNYHTFNSHIVAIDGDLLYTQGKHYNWRKNEWVDITIQEEQKKFWSDMIVGQPGDNVKGLPGKGIKYVEKLFIDIIHIEDYRNIVLKEYIFHYLSEYEGIKEFYKNYISLKILDNMPDFRLPEIREYKQEIEKPDERIQGF